MSSSNPTVEQQIAGSRQSHYWQELFRNTGQFPLGILLIESLREGWEYFSKPDLYVLIPAALIQTWWLTRNSQLSGWQRFLGNLIAPFLYTSFEVAIEGLKFFEALHHSSYWGFAIVLGILQALRSSKNNVSNNIVLILENLVRAQILFAAYAIYETYSNPQQTESLVLFFSDPSHLLIFLTTLVLGFSAGLADLNAQNLFTSVQKTAKQLKIYSEWLLGRDLLGRALNNPESMGLARKERTILFMDIRNFTRWSETRTPETVAILLNQYYAAIEKVLENYDVIKFKFTADEVMAVFINPSDAVFAARELIRNMDTLLTPTDLGAGVGINTGELVEGLLGGQNLRFYDVLGDTVNTAQRIEANARSGEILVSETTYMYMNNLETDAKKEIQVKGKEYPLKVYSVTIK